MPTQTAQPVADPVQASTIHQSLQALEARALILPCLLFVASHRPCAFVVGQLLYVIAPLAALLGSQTWQDWAGLLSEPAGVTWLEKTLGDMVNQGDKFVV
ncbi:hypothetical protein BH10CHL1_BH10CHL1_22820 [soil metagenome]